MKKAVKHPFFAVLFIIMVMALTCIFTTTTENAAYNSNTAVSGFFRNETILRDRTQLKEYEILQANARRKTIAEKQADAAEQTEKTNTAVLSAFQLPASLKYIDDEAFAGTALVNVDIPENVEYIGERAFSNIPTLRKVIIPEKTKAIAKSAFAGSNRVTIIGAPGSYARKYAKENGIPFAPLTVIYANAGADSGISLQQTRTSDEAHDTEEDDGQNDYRPADRIAGEIKANITENGAAYHIIGRAPPVNA